MSFSGFSQEDIRKFNDNNETNQSRRPSDKLVALRKPAFSNKPNKQNEMRRIVSNYCAAIPESAKLSLPKEEGVNVPEPKVEEKVTQIEVLLEEKQVVEDRENQDERIQEEVVPTTEIQKRHEKLNLDEFEARQKLIEEQNRMRKELLAKALADRTKRTQEEALRLQEIQDELQHLDVMLSCDVKILRKQIEAASVDFADCQKKYHKIEKEFLEAKLLLQQKLDKKEMLTEYLCTIIEKNEERKAEKLNELLGKLQLNPGEVVRENGEH